MPSGPSSSIEETSHAKGRFHLALVAALGVLVSTGIFAVLQRLEHLRTEATFLQTSEQRLSAVRTNVDGALDTIAILASHFEATSEGGTSRRAFRTLVAPVLANHRYLQALEWIPRVESKDRSRYELLARADGIADFRFREVGRDGSMTPAGKRDEYFPVFYVEPVAENERALGYDLASNPVRRAAMQQARDTGRLAATARVRLVQEKGDEWGTLVFAPVYKLPSEATQEALQGFGLSVLRIGDLIAAADYASRIPHTSPSVDIHLFDMSAAEPDRQLYPRSPVTTPERLAAGLHTEEQLEVGGRKWLLLATPGAGFVERPSSAGSLLVLVFGLLLTGLYLRYLRAGSVQSEQIAKAAKELERTEADLKQTNGMLEAVIRCSPLAVVVLDLEGKVTMWNPAAERMHGWTKEEVTGKCLPFVLPKNGPDEVRRVHDRVLHEGGVTGLEYVVLTKKGRPITVSVSGAPLHNAAGEQNGAVYLVTDITERKQLESQLAQAQKLESIGQLAAGIAHEINTPIQYVGDNLRFLLESFQSRERFLGAHRRLCEAVKNGQTVDSAVAECEAAAQLEDQDYLQQEIPRALQESLEGTDQVARIVRATKEFSHCGAAERTAVDINHAIESTILVSRHEWKYVAELKTEFGDLPPVQCIPGELNQVILNLIINAAHAIADAVGEQSGAKGIITVSTLRDREWIEIRVRDTGTGIPEAVRPHIFNPFFTTKGVGKGTGQGLAIAHATVVRRHGGSITFETEMGVGTTFIVRLPIGTA